MDDVNIKWLAQWMARIQRRVDEQDKSLRDDVRRVFNRIGWDSLPDFDNGTIRISGSVISTWISPWLTNIVNSELGVPVDDRMSEPINDKSGCDTAEEQLIANELAEAMAKKLSVPEAVAEELMGI